MKALPFRSQSYGPYMIDGLGCAYSTSRLLDAMGVALMSYAAYQIGVRNFGNVLAALRISWTWNVRQSYLLFRSLYQKSRFG